MGKPTGFLVDIQGVGPVPLCLSEGKLIYLYASSPTVHGVGIKKYPTEITDPEDMQELGYITLIKAPAQRIKKPGKAGTKPEKPKIKPDQKPEKAEEKPEAKPDLKPEKAEEKPEAKPEKKGRYSDLI